MVKSCQSFFSSGFKEIKSYCCSQMVWGAGGWLKIFRQKSRIGIVDWGMFLIFRNDSQDGLIKNHLC